MVLPHTGAGPPLVSQNRRLRLADVWLLVSYQGFAHEALEGRKGMGVLGLHALCFSMRDPGLFRGRADRGGWRGTRRSKYWGENVPHRSYHAKSPF